MENKENSKNKTQEEAEPAKASAAETKVLLSGLRDRSLQAYKDFIMEIVSHMGIQDDGSTTDEKWEARWREYWKNADGAESQDEG